MSRLRCVLMLCVSAQHFTASHEEKRKSVSAASVSNELIYPVVWRADYGQIIPPNQMLTNLRVKRVGDGEIREKQR